MPIIFINVIFVLTAIAMIVLILLQRGPGASAGSGFGGGASATVFGARGSANFLSKATKWCAIVFFSISLGLAWYASKPRATGSTASDLGVMSQAAGSKTPSASQPSSVITTIKTPVVPAPVGGGTPVVPNANGAPAVPAPQPLPGAPAGATAPAGAIQPNVSPAVPAPQPVAPAPHADNGAKSGSKNG